jgi:Flp pilus assembly protein TadG
MIEFALGFPVLMFLAVASAQVALVLHFGGSLDTAAREGAFQASLAGHGPADGAAAARQLWNRLQPGVPVTVSVHGTGRQMVVTLSASAPLFLPVPVPPFTRIDLQHRATHTVETFEAGSAPS